MSTTHASVRRHSRAGACRTSMNSRKMMRTLMSAITIALDGDHSAGLQCSVLIDRVVHPDVGQRHRRQHHPDDQQSLVEC